MNCSEECFSCVSTGRSRSIGTVSSSRFGKQSTCTRPVEVNFRRQHPLNNRLYIYPQAPTEILVALVFKVNSEDW